MSDRSEQSGGKATVSQGDSSLLSGRVAAYDGGREVVSSKSRRLKVFGSVKDVDYPGPTSQRVIKGLKTSHLHSNRLKVAVQSRKPKNCHSR